MADTAELAIVHATTASASWLTDPTVFAANRKPAHSSHRYVIGETSEPKQSLDGEWKVRIEQARNVDVESAPFAAVDFEDGDLGAIEVPGHLQMAGYLRNKYVNIQYPWDGHEDPQAPNIPENNHVAIYRRRFALDAQLARTLENDGTVSLTFHGAATAIYVWLDGTFVGYGEDGFTPSEFDVTEALRNGNGNAADSPEAEHTLTVACYEYSSASWLEDQDFWRLHGLFRSVELAAQPRTHVETMQIEVDYDTTGITDTAKIVPVQYKGILPDLFAEGQGVVAQGKLDEQGVFCASEVLAKHDENYMPPEAAKALEDAHKAGVAKKQAEQAQAAKS